MSVRFGPFGERITCEVAGLVVCILARSLLSIFHLVLLLFAMLLPLGMFPLAVFPLATLPLEIAP
jgi:hypothetical protein